MSSHPRFICDVMLGSLARWLRLLGYDTLYFHHIGDNEMIRISRSEERILVTRDRDLFQRSRRISGDRSAVLITGDQLAGQISEARVNACHYFSVMPSHSKRPRCGVCNGPLQAISKEALPSHIPSHVRHAHSQFQQCASCTRIYWGGSHRKKIDQTINRFEATTWQR